MSERWKWRCESGDVTVVIGAREDCGGGVCILDMNLLSRADGVVCTSQEIALQHCPPQNAAQLHDHPDSKQ